MHGILSNVVARAAGAKNCKPEDFMLSTKANEAAAVDVETKLDSLLGTAPRPPE